jgi:ABC-type lipoprotein release transport system permease subunit
MISTTLKLAARNLGRNPRRTLLSVVGIGIACAMALLFTGLRRSVGEVYARAAAESGAGNVRISPEGWLKKRDPRLRLANGEEALRIARAFEAVKVAAPRSRAEALLAMGTRVSGVELVGVDPIAEPESYRFVRTVLKGRYLRPGDEGAIVIGNALAEHLRVDVDDDLVATVVGEGGAIERAMFRIAGIVTSKSREIDSTIAQVTLADLARVSKIDGIGEIAVLFRDQKALPERKAQLEKSMPGKNLVLTWAEVAPDLERHLKQDGAMTQLMSAIITLVVLLGVASAQLTAVLERRKEFAVLAAIGMKPRRLVEQLFLEAMTTGVLGAVAGLIVAAPLLYLLARYGFDITALYGSNTAFEGVLVEPRMYGDFGPWMVPYALSLSLSATIIGAIYPAVFAARTDPASALRVAA